MSPTHISPLRSLDDSRPPVSMIRVSPSRTYVAEGSHPRGPGVWRLPVCRETWFAAQYSTRGCATHHLRAAFFHCKPEVDRPDVEVEVATSHASSRKTPAPFFFTNGSLSMRALRPSRCRRRGDVPRRSHRWCRVRRAIRRLRSDRPGPCRRRHNHPR